MLDTEELAIPGDVRLGDFIEGHKNGHDASPRYDTGLNAVAIVGFAPSSLKHALESIFPNPDWVPEKKRYIWGLNELYKVLELHKVPVDHWDRWFDIHDPRSSISTRDADNVKWLAAQTKPIYMVQHYADIPASVPYPLKEVINYFESRYLTNTISMMILLACMEGRYRQDVYQDGKLIHAKGDVEDPEKAFGEIHVYGVDMAQDSEYSHQRPSCEAAIGFARGLGIKVWIPPTSDLMAVPFIYGFEGSGQQMRAKMDARIGELKAQADGHRAIGNNAKVATAAFIAVCNEMAAIVNKHLAQGVQHPILEDLKDRINELQPEIQKANQTAETNLMRAAMLDGAHDDSAYWRRAHTGT